MRENAAAAITHRTSQELAKELVEQVAVDQNIRLTPRLTAALVEVIQEKLKGTTLRVLKALQES